MSPKFWECRCPLAPLGSLRCLGTCSACCITSPVAGKARGTNSHPCGGRERSGEQQAGTEGRSGGRMVTPAFAHVARFSKIRRSMAHAVNGHDTQLCTRSPVWTSDQHATGTSGCKSGGLSSSPASMYGPSLTLRSWSHLSPLPALVGWFRTCRAAVT